MSRSNSADLYAVHSHELTRFARRRVGREDASDVVQEAYLRVLRYGGAAEADNPRAYLYRVIANAAFDWNSAAPAHAQHANDGVDLDALATEAPGPEAAAMASQQLRTCLEVLEELPAEQRHAFLLHRLDGLSQREVSKALGIPLRTVERHIARALAQCLGRLSESPNT